MPYANHFGKTRRKMRPNNKLERKRIGRKKAVRAFKTYHPNEEPDSRMLGIYSKTRVFYPSYNKKRGKSRLTLQEIAAALDEAEELEEEHFE